MARHHQLLALATACLLILSLAGCKKDDESGGDEEEELDLSHGAICDHLSSLSKKEGKETLPKAECTDFLEKLHEKAGDSWDEFATCAITADNVKATETCYEEILADAVAPKDDATLSPNSVCTKMEELSPYMGGDCQADLGKLKRLVGPEQWDAFSTCMMDASDAKTGEGCFDLVSE